ncbi:MAG: phosphotransferase [Egibacteraceae bacterium]
MTLDPLANPALQRELPGLVTAFDGKRMGALLGAALGTPITACSPGKATYLPGDSCLVRYQVQVASADHVVCGRVFPDRAASACYVQDQLAPLADRVVGRPELAPFSDLIAHIQPLAMAVSVFPVDGDLPMLVDATDPERMLGVLRARLGGHLDGCRVDVVAYPRRGRCVLRYELQPGGRTVYGKITAAGEGAYTPAVIEGLRAGLDHRGGHPPVAIPRSLGYDSSLRLVLMEPLHGTPEASGGVPPNPLTISRLLRAWGKGEAVAAVLSLEELLDACAGIAAMLHTSGVALGAARTFEVEVAGLRESLRGIRRLDPVLAGRLEAWLGHAETLAARTAPLRTSLAHGDFTHSQIVFDERGAAGLLDFDDICQAEPALDLGQFTAYLKLGGAKRSGRALGAAPFVDRFLRAYGKATGEPDSELIADRHAAYEICSLVRMAEHAWYKLKPARLDHVLDALEGASSWQRRAVP